MNIDKLKQILDAAPEGATHFETMEHTSTIFYLRRRKHEDVGCFIYEFFDECGWFQNAPSGTIRSLSDIKLIVELHEGLKEALEWVDDHPGMPPTGHLHELLSKIKGE